MYLSLLLQLLAVSAPLLAITAVVNHKLEGKRAGFWTKILHMLLTAGLLFIPQLWFFFNVPRGPIPSWAGEYLASLCLSGIFLMCTFFFVTDYLQYRKQKDDPQAMQKILKNALIFLAGAPFLCLLTLVLMLLLSPHA